MADLIKLLLRISAAAAVMLLVVLLYKWDDISQSLDRKYDCASRGYFPEKCPPSESNVPERGSR